MKNHLLLKLLIVLGIAVLMVLASFASVHGQSQSYHWDTIEQKYISDEKYDTLKKGDHVWIMDGEDSAFGRVAEIAVDWFGHDYFGNNSWVLIRFPESGGGMRGIALSSLYKIHNCDEMIKYKWMEVRKMANDKANKVRENRLDDEDRKMIDDIVNSNQTKEFMEYLKKKYGAKK